MVETIVKAIYRAIQECEHITSKEELPGKISSNCEILMDTKVTYFGRILLWYALKGRLPPDVPTNVSFSLYKCGGTQPSSNSYSDCCSATTVSGEEMLSPFKWRKLFCNGELHVFSGILPEVGSVIDAEMKVLITPNQQTNVRRLVIGTSPTFNPFSFPLKFIAAIKGTSAEFTLGPGQGTGGVNIDPGSDLGPATLEVFIHPQDQPVYTLHDVLREIYS